MTQVPSSKLFSADGLLLHRSSLTWATRARSPDDARRPLRRWRATSTADPTVARCPEWGTATDAWVGGRTLEARGKAALPKTTLLHGLLDVLQVKATLFLAGGSPR